MVRISLFEKYFSLAQRLESDLVEEFAEGLFRQGM
jgi:hypothetical protein